MAAPVRPEIIPQLTALDCQIADLMLKCQSARELDELAGVLGNHIACCEFERDSLLGVSDSPPPPAPLTITDLPANEQRLIFETATFGAVGLKMILMLNPLANPEYIMNQLSQAVQIAMEGMSEAQITDSLHGYLEMHKNNLSKEVFRSNFQSNNN
ncbi:hypothetical protein [Microcoleus sp. N9_B4]|uniref:hypothetical protein n=1 Tax=Microcoleus sp. N9_B4 TaxID=3055386 RepID=UPI002FD59C48